MIRLRTLGALDLRLPDGSEVHSVLAQPKRLALLTYLAATTPLGYHRRDTLLGLFWPDLDQQHARNALSRAVYYLRRALGEATIVSRGDEELRLEEKLVTCDVVALENALEAGHSKRALDIYGGDFLEGFFLSSAPAFERWMDDKRAALRAQAVQAAWSLAQTSEAAGDLWKAEQWVRQALVLSPYDEEGLGRLMHLLDRRGDRAQAIAAYQQFVQRIRDDLDVEPSGPARLLADTWRRSRSGDRPVSEPNIQSTRPPAIEQTASKAPAPRSRVRSTRRRSLLVLTVLVGCLWILEPRGMGWGGDAPPTTVATIAVFPFTVRAQTPDQGFLREGMVDILSAKLNSAVGVRSLDPTVFLQAANIPTSRAVSPADGRVLAKRFGARFYLLGRIVQVGHRLQVWASLYESHGDVAPVTSVAVNASDDDLFKLVDDLAAELLGGLGGTSERLANVASITTQSPIALRAYLEGEQSFRKANFTLRVRFTETVRAFSEAVKLDSTFALAYYRLAVVASWADSVELERRAAAGAARYSARLPTYYRLLVEGQSADIAGDGGRSMAAYRTAATTHPEDAEAWVRLGNVTAIYGPLLGRGTDDMGNAFTLAARYDPRNPVPWVFLSHLAALDDDFRGIDTLLARAYPDGLPPYWQAIIALVGQDSTTIRRALARLDQAEPWQQSYAAMLITQLLGDAATARRISRAAATSASGSDWEAQAHRTLFQIELAAGRPNAALHALENLETVDRSSAVEYDALLTCWPSHPASTPQLQTARAALRRNTEVALRSTPLFGKPSAEGSRVIRLYLAGLLSAHVGDRIDAFRHVQSLKQIAPSPALGSLASDLALYLEAETRVLLDSAVADALRLLLNARRQIPVRVLKAHSALYPLLARQRFLQAEWLQATGQQTDALEWFGSLGRVDQVFDVPFLGPARLRSAQIHEDRGERSEARRDYMRFISLWRDAEADLRPLVDEARKRLAALEH